MKGGKITGNHATRFSGGLSADGCPLLEMFDGAEISGNIVGESGSTLGDNAGGVGLVFSTLTMHQGSRITGNKLYSGFGGGLYVTGESTLIMKGGEISNNECTIESDDTIYNAGFGGGLELANKSSLVMEGGSIIKDNTAAHEGGGIYLVGESSFTMTGGSITNNTAEGNGGGIHMNSSLFTMTGGSITNNTAKDNGGGIDMGGWDTFTMRGGDITGNKAEKAGGGVFLNYGASLNMTNGGIAKNTAKTLGGGIYVRGFASADNPPKPAAVFTMSGGHVYGKDNIDNKNIAGENNAQNAGQAVYVRKAPPDASVSHDDTIDSFPVPAPPAP
jgi:predicted outer membrane repeat protein